MDEDNKQDILQRQIEALAENLQKLTTIQNAQYTDIMLALKKIEEQTANKVGGYLEDGLYENAKELVIDLQMASASLLQRTLRIGYARAAHLIDLLEAEGVIGKSEGNRPREVLIQEVE